MRRVRGKGEREWRKEGGIMRLGETWKGRNSPRKKTWYSKARFNSGIHMSSSKYCLVMGEITCDALRALLTISFLVYQLSLLQFPLSLSFFNYIFFMEIKVEGDWG